MSKQFSIGVQFSGKPTVYFYACDEGEHPFVGQRVVVPTVMKNDGTVTLTIGTVVEVYTSIREGAVKPIISLLPALAIANATQVCVKLEADAKEAA